MNEIWVYLNGCFILESLASIPVTDRGFLYGEGVFTTIRVESGRCELISSHFARLKNQAKDLNFDWEPISEEIIKELIRLNKADKGIWRLKIVVTVKEEGAFRSCGCKLVFLHPYQEPTSSPLSLCLFPLPVMSPLASIKSLSYLDRLHVRNFAAKIGAADAIMQTQEGILLETGSSNLFWIDQEKLWMPDPILPYLKGVFLQAILSFLQLPVRCVKARIDQIPLSANIYICNAMTHVRPVHSIAEMENNAREKDSEDVLKGKRGGGSNTIPTSNRLFPLSPKWETILMQAVEKALNF